MEFRRVLFRSAPGERHEAERIDGGVRKIVEAIGDQGAGIAYRAGDKECRGNRRIEKKHDPQRSPFTIHIRILLRHRMSLSVSLPKKRSEEHTSELQSLMRISYAVFCLKKKKTKIYTDNHTYINRKLHNK